VYGLWVSRTRILIVSAVIALATAGVFALFIGFRSNAPLVAALEAAGTVAAAGFAALAALGSMRAAAESSATARRSREALARTVRPRVYPSFSQEYGTVRCEERVAVDVSVAWLLTGGETVTEQVARLEPSNDLTLDLKLPGTANVWDTTSMVWIEYWDESRVGRWQDTWRVNQEKFLQADSRLVD
jgi:hypothetical protein